jgi:hypothetical protein
VYGLCLLLFYLLVPWSCNLPRMSSQETSELVHGFSWTWFKHLFFCIGSTSKIATWIFKLGVTLISLCRVLKCGMRIELQGDRGWKVCYWMTLICEILLLWSFMNWIWIWSISGMRLTGDNWSKWRRNCPIATTNPTWTDLESDLILCSERPVTNCWDHCMANRPTKDT